MAVMVSALPGRGGYNSEIESDLDVAEQRHGGHHRGGRHWG